MGTLDPEMVEDWAPARLISPAGIRGAKEQEERATSALLAAMAVVPSFGRRVLKTVGAPAGTISAFIEPHFETDKGGTAIPDGAIYVKRGKTEWLSLVEVKTGASELGSDQINRYLTIANREGFDAVLTISNQIVADGSESPVDVDNRKTKKITLGHISWFRILTEAIIEHEHYGIDDPEQASIIGDLIAYLDDSRSGAAGFDGMGKEWVAVRDAARNKTLRARDPGVAEVAEDWEQFVEYLALRLRQELGRDVAPVHGRSSTRQSRLDDHIKTLVDDGVLDSSLKIRDAVAPIDIEASLSSRQVTTHARIKAPGEGRAKTRVTWLLRQLKGAPPTLRVTAKFARTRTTTSLLLSDVAANPAYLLLPDDRKREPVAFDVALMRNMGSKKGKDKGSFVAETMEQVLAFYGEVLQDIRGWTRPPARLSEEQIVVDELDVDPEPEQEVVPDERATSLATWDRPPDWQAT
jgi:hypothetical protein